MKSSGIESATIPLRYKQSPRYSVFKQLHLLELGNADPFTSHTDYFPLTRSHVLCQLRMYTSNARTMLIKREFLFPKYI
jgi:hypothetical protein